MEARNPSLLFLLSSYSCSLWCLITTGILQYDTSLARPKCFEQSMTTQRTIATAMLQTQIQVELVTVHQYAGPCYFT